MLNIALLTVRYRSARNKRVILINAKNASCRAIALLNIAIISTTRFIPIGAHPR